MATVASGVRVPAGSPFPATFPEEQLGGWREVDTLTDRDNIPVERRTIGMTVYVVANAASYTLLTGLTNADWVTAPLGVANRVVFQPGGPVNASPVFNDWASLVTAVNAAGVPALIDFDPEFATTAIPTGTWNFTKPVIFWANLGQGQFIQFDAGASVSNVVEIRGAIINILGSGSPAAVVQAPGQIGINLQDGFVQGSRPLIEVSTVARIRVINCDFDGGSSRVVASGFAILSLLGSTDIPNNTITGAGTVNFEINADSTAPSVLSGFTGTANYTYQDPTQQPFITRTSAGTLDGRRAYVFNSGAGFSQAMPDPAVVNGPLKLKNIGAGTITLTNASGTVSPSSLATGESAVFQGNGTNWEGF